MEAEQARKELDRARSKGALARRIRLDRTLPGELGQLIGKALKQGDCFPARHFLDEHRAEVGQLFEGMSDRTRHQLTKTLLPDLALTVDAAWKAMEHRPYLRGEARRPFRCPRSAATLAQLRGTWLLKLAVTLGDYERDITWVATWAAALSSWDTATMLGWLLAGALDQADDVSDKVLEVLKSSAAGDHEVAQMGRHVTQALMASSREDAWEFNEKLLLAAQRQEGLRQAILEVVDESHPEAFRRMLRLILKENLARFSSVVRAADTWFGFMWDGSSGLKLNEVLVKVLLYLDDPDQAARSIAAGDPEAAYLALWTLAFEDVDLAVSHAAHMLQDPSVEKRFVASHLLAQTGWDSSLRALVNSLQDDDLRVAARALSCFAQDVSPWVESPALFRVLEQLLKRLEKRSTKLKGLVWPWMGIDLKRSDVAQAMSANSSSLPVAKLLPYLKDLDPLGRVTYICRLAGLPAGWDLQKHAKPKPLDGEGYEAILDHLGDPSSDVRSVAFRAIACTPPGPAEKDRIVDLLRRKPGDLRRLCIDRLRSLPDVEMLEAATQLLGDKHSLRRLAGLEVLRDAVERERSVAEARELAQEYCQDRDVLSDGERTHIDAIVGTVERVVERSDALGLIDAGELPVWADPMRLVVKLESDAASRCSESLARLILENQDVEVDDECGDRVLLIDASFQGLRLNRADRADDQEGELPLADVWRSWLAQRSDDLRDLDGLELVRAWIAPVESSRRSGVYVKRLFKVGEWAPGAQVLEALLRWCIRWQQPERSFELLLDGLESSLAKLTESDFRDMDQNRGARIRVMDAEEDRYELRIRRAESWLRGLRELRSLVPARLREQDSRRLYALLRWFQVRSKGYGALRLQLRDFLDGYRIGMFGDAGVAEFTDLLVGQYSDQHGLNFIENVSGHRPAAEIADHPELQEAVERSRRRIVEVETQRGDRATVVSSAALKLRWSGGLETMSLAIQALGDTKFARNEDWFSDCSRKDTLSCLVLRSTPRKGDSPEAFARWAGQARVGEARLVELAAYAPQWAEHVNHVLGWPCLESAVWWVHAHTKGDSWDMREIGELWTAQLSERTPLSANDLTEGAVDVGWFHAVYAELGAERWKKLYKAAKYASNSGGQKRTQLFASAMTGEVTRTELLQRIDEKRHQDSVRALGLIPLLKGRQGQKDLLERYHRLQSFKRESRKFGSQRQVSEGRAMTVGMENLARTAGFKDPLRLQWAMEMESVKDLAQGPLALAKGEVVLELSIDKDGKPHVGVRKEGREQKSIPAKIRKDPDVVELKARLKELRRQASRVNGALEEAMCRGDEFDGSELKALLEHPILAPSLLRLVFIGDDIIGYPAAAGKALMDDHGKLEPVRKQESLRLAHPHDLLERRDWSSWQRECFRSERVQPFKQVFRELYPITETEQNDKFRSRRYAGHQVNPRQALALLGGRGWVVRPEEGVSKTYHQEGLTARLSFEEAFYTPAEIEGLTLEQVEFTEKGKWEPLDVATLPARVFSETMRDLDLVVSVAHQGGVDPEATASTMEMRALLVRESCALLGLKNVEVKEHNVIVRGERGHYSVHLGSAIARLLGGSSLVIVAIPSQHRGRLFLPFADDDPRTAEALSKVLLLARDREIKDPSILEQIRQAQR